jgi:hypothetical protein
MRRITAVILLVLFSLGAFGVSFEQHFCCHSQQEESTKKHCTDDESCCNENDNCCDEISAQVKISKNYNSPQSKLSFEIKSLIIPVSFKRYHSASVAYWECKTSYSIGSFLPPPKNYQTLYSSILI